MWQVVEGIVGAIPKVFVKSECVIDEKYI